MNHKIIASTPQNEKFWYCHCCLAKNSVTLNSIEAFCKVCNQPSHFVMEKISFPIHGERGASTYRPEQVLNILSDINQVDQFKWSTLHYAAIVGNSDVVRDLIKYKIEVDALTIHGQVYILNNLQDVSIKINYCVFFVIPYSTDFKLKDGIAYGSICWFLSICSSLDIWWCKCKQINKF